MVSVADLVPPVGGHFVLGGVIVGSVFGQVCKLWVRGGSSVHVYDLVHTIGDRGCHLCQHGLSW